MATNGELSIDGLLDYFENCDSGEENTGILSPKSSSLSKEIEKRLSSSGQIQPSKEALRKDNQVDSEDEDFLYDNKKTLSEEGASIKRLIENVKTEKFPERTRLSSSKQSSWNSLARNATSQPKKPVGELFVVDPLFGFRIIKPRIPMEFVRSSASSSRNIQLSALIKQRAVLESDDSDWVTIGAVVSKTDTRQTKIGNSYNIFHLCDMNNVDLEFTTLFLFGEAYKKHWKLPVGTVVGLLNPSLMPNEKKTSSISLSVRSPSQLLVIGTSKDLSTCRATTKAGNICTKPVNKSQCDKCSYHAMQAYKHISNGRAELNNAYSGRAPASTQQRIMANMKTGRSGKDDLVFYGGKCYSTKSMMSVKASLTGVLTSEKANKTHISQVLDDHRINPADLERIKNKRFQSRSTPENAEDVRNQKRLETMISQPSAGGRQIMQHLINSEKSQGELESNTQLVPTVATTPSDVLRQERLKRESLNIPSKSSEDRANMTREQYNQLRLDRAKRKIGETGGITKENPNAVRTTLTMEQKEAIKRRASTSSVSGSSQTNKISSKFSSEKSCKLTTSRDLRGDDEENKQPNKRQKFSDIKLTDDEIEKIRNTRCSNSHLQQQVENDRQEKYFKVLERKEQYQEKLESTHAVEASLYICTVCDYQDWHLAKRCFQEKHKYIKSNVLKKFFRCKDCKERTCTHNKFPTKPCSKCGGQNYEKTGLLSEKIVTQDVQLSLRGNEEANLGNIQGKINLDISG